MQYKHLGSILLIAAMTLCACQHRHQPSEYIQTADSLLWSNPDSCLRYIESRTGELSEYDQNCEELIWQHAVYKIYNQVEDNLQLEKCKLYFDYIHNWERAGESDYVLGAHYLKHGDCFEATVHLKRAEDYYQYCQPKPILNGMLYLYLGAAAEENCMYEVAAEYYQKAIPYLKEAQKPLYLANVYSRLGGCWDGADSTMVITYLDSAQNYARQAGMEQMYRETRARKALYINKTDKKSKEKLLIDLIYLCDTSQLYQYAEIIAKEYLEHNELDKAHQYIEQLKKDTSVHIHSKEQVYALSADLLYRQGKASEAYIIGKQLHEWQNQEISKSTYATTYIVSQKYEAAKEQLWRQEEQEKKERAYLWLAICALLCLLAGSSAGYLLLRHKKTQLQLQLNEERSRRLEQEVEAQQKVLQAKLRERVEVVKQLHQWSSKHDIKLPKSIDLLSPQRAARDQDNWKKFYEEYNLCYADKLNRMKEQNPELTESDLQCLALEDLGFDTSEMAFILGLTKRTVWNRRNLAKQHLGEILIEN